jgi:hypothetical protein
VACRMALGAGEQHLREHAPTPAPRARNRFWRVEHMMPPRGRVPGG